MKVGDLVRYKHNQNKIGLIVQISNQRIDSLLVLWQQPSAAKRRWYVQPLWVEVVNESR